MKIFLVICLLFTIIFADNKLFVDSKYIAKILTYDLDIQKKIIHNVLKVAIICKKKDLKKANILANNLFKTLSNKFNINQIEIDLILENKYKNLKDYSFIYVFGLENPTNIYNDSKKMQIISFCHNDVDIEKGCAIYINENTNNKIICNKSVISDSKILFDTKFLKVIKNYE